MIINCRFGLRIVKDAHTANIEYNNQFYYTNADYFIPEFNASDGVEHTQPDDIRSTAPKTNNPIFAMYNVYMFDYSTITPPVSISAYANYNFNGRRL